MAEETPETNEPEANEPEAAVPEPEAAAPEADAPEADAPEAPAPDADAAEAPEPEAAASEPEPTPAPAAAEPVAPATPKERKLASRAKRGRRRASTPEERKAERAKKAADRTRRRGQEREKARAVRAATPATEPVAAAKEHGPGRPKTREGRVVSSKADKTITIRIETARRHRRYEKIVRSTSTLHAHDEANDAGEGDLVRIIESRPLSRTKRWRLVEVLERAK